MIDDVLLALFVIDLIAAKHGNDFVALNSPFDEEEIEHMLNNEFVQLRMTHFGIYKEVLSFTGLIDDQDVNSVG
jgi:hypothetical protein